MNDNPEENVEMNESMRDIEYPRTGKRGVPQQFPRRLYHMLEMESTKEEEEGPRFIAWSPSGTAFKIDDPTQFSSIILPKYFKTNMFSSFQRNMNLYGFTKLRRGPEADMYAHPDFVRGKPENLYKLQKLNKSNRRKAGLSVGSMPSTILSHQATKSSGAASFAKSSVPNTNAGNMYDPRSFPRDQAPFMYPIYHPYPPYRPPYGSYPNPFPPMFMKPPPDTHAKITSSYPNYPSNPLPFSNGPMGVPILAMNQNKITREDSTSTNAPTSVTVEDSIAEDSNSVISSTLLTTTETTDAFKSDTNQTEETGIISEPTNDHRKREDSSGERSVESSKMSGLLTLAMTCLKDEK